MIYNRTRPLYGIIIGHFDLLLHRLCTPLYFLASIICSCGGSREVRLSGIHDRFGYGELLGELGVHLDLHLADALLFRL